MNGVSPGLEAMLVQFGPFFQKLANQVKPMVDQPVIRLPYGFPLVESATIPAGTSGQVLNNMSFSNNFEWPFECHWVKFSQDQTHTFRDWRVNIQDQTFQQPLQKSTIMVADLVDDNTGKWEWEFPWIIRPKGGAMYVTVDNLDDVNPITIDISFGGYFMQPRGQ